MDPHKFRLLMDEQAGVVSRRQLLAIGADAHDISRLVRRRDLAVVFRGVYVNHTGPLTWLQRAWAAVLSSWPAALSHQSALRAAMGPGRRESDESTIHIVVARDRSIQGPPGVQVHRKSNFAHTVHWNLGPPRVRLEEAVLDIAVATGTDFEAIAVLADACQARRTTAQRLLDRLVERPCLPKRAWLVDVLKDVARGASSVLEYGYVHQVLKAHGLPLPELQVRAITMTGGVVYRDSEYAGSLVIELDGRLFHDSATQRDRDFDRDLDAAISRRETLRLSYGQVFARACLTAQKLALLFGNHGWEGRAHACGPGCVLA